MNLRSKLIRRCQRIIEIQVDLELAIGVLVVILIGPPAR